MYQKVLQNINEFYRDENDDNAKITKLFMLLKDVVDFDDCGIFYLVPNSLNLEQSFGGKFAPIYSINDDATQKLYDTKFDDV